MNTMGKILVLLNLVFALLTGGFLLMAYTGRTDWQEEAKNREGIAKVSVADAEGYVKTARQAIENERKARSDLDKYLIESKDTENRLHRQVQEALGALEQSKKQLNQATLNAKASQEESARRHQEVKMLGKVLQEREATIAELQKESSTYRQELLAAKERATVAVARASAALEQVRSLTKKIHEMQTEGGSGGVMVSDAKLKQSPNYENPPQADVKGSIRKVTPEDPRLVEISIGSDHGVRKDNTLEVYRLRPKAEYLGRLLVVDVHHHSAIGQMIRTPGARPPVLRVGDEVASRIQ